MAVKSVITLKKANRLSLSLSCSLCKLDHFSAMKNLVYDSETVSLTKSSSRGLIKASLFDWFPSLKKHRNNCWRNESQHNDTQHNDTQHNDSHHNDSQHNDTQHNYTQHNDIHLNYK
jgi:hypothetical protein